MNTQQTAFLRPASFLMVLAGPLAGCPPQSPTTTLVSMNDAGEPGDGYSGSSTTSSALSVSADGRYVCFKSIANNLVPNGTPDREHHYVRDLVAGRVRRVSVNCAGVEANSGHGIASGGQISADGRFVVFSSFASNLVAGDTNGRQDVFVHKLATGITTCASVNSAGQMASGSVADTWAWGVSISGDGRYVAFASWATNLVPGDNNGKSDLFLRDRTLLTTTRIGEAGYCPALSADGRYIAFCKETAVKMGKVKWITDVYVFDQQTGRTARASVGAGGAQANGNSGWPTISADGRYVAFSSNASNLVSGDTNGQYDAFVRDMVAGITIRVAASSGSVPSISGNGRYVAFWSFDASLVPGDTNGVADVFVRDLVTATTTRASVGYLGQESNDGAWSYSSVAINGDGMVVAFPSKATNLVPQTITVPGQVYVRH